MQQISRATLILFLEATLEAVKADDSMEGRIQYEWGDTPGQYRVDAFVRVGNSEGQGSSIIIHAPEDI